MKKVLTFILIVALCLTLIVGVIGCSDKGSENPPENDNNQTPPQIDDGGASGGEGDGSDVPRAEYTRETIDGVTYIFYGSAPQKAAGTEITGVLQNLVSTSQITPNESGYYTYGGVEYACVKGTEDSAGRKLSNGLAVEKDKYYFFTIDPIRWRVLEENDGEALLLCDTVLGEYCFNPTDSYNRLGYLVGTEIQSNDYAESALRTYVNDTLYNSVFTISEKQFVLEKTVYNRPAESAFVVSEGLMTSSDDKLFTLSYREAVKEEYGLLVAKDKVMATIVSDYQVCCGIYCQRVGNYYYAPWWLRTSGSHVNYGNIVTFDGVIGTDARCSVNLDYVCGVRPALWLKV